MDIVFENTALCRDRSAAARRCACYLKKLLFISQIKDFGGEKGRGVVATHSFKAGDYITVYTGRLMTAKEGYEAEQSKGEKDGSFQFFFPFRNQMYW